jgi:PadR family transcriptional regulator PadR
VTDRSYGLPSPCHPHTVASHLGRVRRPYVYSYIMALSKSRAKILGAFLADPSQEQYGFGLMRSTGVKSGALYPILDSLEKRGWVQAYDENIDERAEKRPRRRLYRLTDLGEVEATKALVEFHSDQVAVPPKLRDLLPRPQWDPT